MDPPISSLLLAGAVGASVALLGVHLYSNRGVSELPTHPTPPKPDLRQPKQQKKIKTAKEVLKQQTLSGLQ